MNRRTKKLVVVLCAAGALVLAAGGAVVAREVIRERRAAAGLLEGKEAYAAGQYEKAMHGLGTYVSRHRDNAQALLLLANARAQVPMENNKHLAAAAKFARDAVELEPRNREALHTLVDLFNRMGFLTESRQFAIRLLEVDPADKAAHTANVSALATIGKWEDARKAANAFVAALPDDVDAHDLLYKVLAQSGTKPSEIRDLAMALLNKHQDNLRIHILAAKAAAGAEDRVTFEDILSRAIKLPVANNAELGELIEMLERTQNADERVAACLDRFGADPNLGRSVRDLRIERDWKLGRKEAAAERAREELKEPGSASAKMLAISTLCLSPTQDATLVSAAFDQLSLRKGADDEYWILVAQGAKSLREANVADARTKFTEAYRRDPHPGFAQYLLADVLFPLGEQSEAIRLLESIVGQRNQVVDPAWRVARSRLVSMQVESGRMADARSSAGIALGLKPALPEVLAAGYANLTGFDAGLVTAQDVKRFSDALDQLSGNSAVEPNILGLRAWSAFALGKPQVAKELLEKLVAAERAPFVEVSTRLLDLSRTPFPQLHTQLLTKFRSLAPDEMTLLAYETAERAVTSGVPAAIELVTNAARNVPESDRARYDILLAVAIENVDPQKAVALLDHALSSPNLSIQTLIAVTESRTAWSRQDLISKAVSGLRDPLGSNSSRYKALEARIKLTFEPTDKSASEVVTSLSPIVQNDHRDVLVCGLLAEAYVKLGNKSAAIDTLQRTLDETGAPNVFPRLISLMQAMGRSKDAEQMLRRFISFGSLPDDLVRERARLLTVQGMFAEAKADIDLLGPRKTPDDYLLLGSVLARTGDVSAAAAAIESARAARPDSLPAIVAAAEIAARAGNTDRGLKIISSMPATIPEPDRKAALASFLARFGSPAQAEEALRASAASGGGTAWADLAQFYLSRNDEARGIEAIENGLKAAPQDSRLLWMKGSLLLAKGDAGMAQSLEALSKAAQAPDAPKFLAEVVEVFKDLSAHPENQKPALKALREISSRYPTQMEVWSLLVRMSFNAGDPGAAVTSALAAQEALPADARAAKLAATTLAGVRRFDEAVVLGTKWRALASISDSDPDLFLASVQLSRGRAADAVAALSQRRADIESGALPGPQPLFQLASALSRNGEVEPAQAMMRSRLKADPSLLDACLAAGGAMVAKPDLARAWLSELAPSATKPSSMLILAESLYQVGIASRTTADLNSAAEMAEKAAADPGVSVKAKRLAAGARQALGDGPRAISLYRDVVAALPSDAVSLNNLAMLLLKSGGAKEAADLSRRATAAVTREEASTQATYFDTLGQCLAAAGDSQEAERAYQQAMSLDPACPDPAIGMLELLNKLGRTEDARKILRRIDESVTMKDRTTPDLRRRLDAARAGVPAN